MTDDSATSLGSILQKRGPNLQTVDADHTARRVQAVCTSLSLQGNDPEDGALVTLGRALGKEKDHILHYVQNLLARFEELCC